MIKNRFSYEELKGRIEEFQKRTALPKLQPPAEIEDILESMNSVGSIRSLSVDELSEHSLILSNYSLYLQSQENNIRGFIYWCESNIKHIVGQNLSSSKEYGYLAKDNEIRATNINIIDLDKIKLEAEVKLQMIEKIAYKIQNISDILISIYRERKRYNK